MASAAIMNPVLHNKLIELQVCSLFLFLCFSCLLAGLDSQELSKEESKSSVELSDGSA